MVRRVLEANYDPTGSTSLTEIEDNGQTLWFVRCRTNGSEVVYPFTTYKQARQFWARRTHPLGGAA